MINLKIDGISESTVKFGKQVTIESGGKKYIFYDKIKGGAESKAYSQYKSADWGVGDTISCEVKEEQKTFTGKEGNPVNYTDRRIIYFGDPAGGVGTPTVANIASPSPLSAENDTTHALTQIRAEIAGLRGRVDGIEKELNDRVNEGKIPL